MLSVAAMAVPALSAPTMDAAGQEGQPDDAVGENQHRPPRGSWHLPRRAASWNEADPYESLFEAARHGDDAELRRLLEDERLDPMELDEVTSVSLADASYLTRLTDCLPQCDKGVDKPTFDRLARKCNVLIIFACFSLVGTICIRSVCKPCKDGHGVYI